MPKSPILGGFSKSFSQSLSNNELVNAFVELVETKDGKVPGALIGAAGLDLVGTIGTGPIRGFCELNDVLYIVSGNQVFSLTANGIATMLGEIGSQGSTPVSMFQNTIQLMIVDGVGGWLVPGGFPLTGGQIAAATSTGDAAGGLYAVNDTVTLKASTGLQTSFPIIQITSVANNPVTQLSLPNSGTAYETNTGVATTAIQPQPGAGTALTLNITASGGVITSAEVSDGGSNYEVGDTGTIGTGNGVYQVASELNGHVSSVVVLVPGTLYATEAGMATTSGAPFPTNIGTGLTLDITAANGPISSSTIDVGGENYAVGNVGLVSGGSGDATYVVNAIGANGSVTGFTVIQGGSVNGQAATFTQQSTSGSGSGLILTSPTFGPNVGLVPITLPFPNPIKGDVSDGFGLLVFLGQQNIAQSNELDLSTWDPLAFGVSDSSPDNCISLAVIHDEAYVLKEKHTEVWIDEGTQPFAFALLTSARIEHGCMAPFSPAIAGESLFWLSRNSQGQGVVVEARGYTTIPVSTQALIAEFDTYPNLGDAIGYARQQGGHLFYVLTFPEADKTWAYDVTASALAGYPLWHRLASFSEGEFHRHWGNCFTPWTGAVTLVVSVVAYQPLGVSFKAPTELETSSGLNGLAPSFSSAIFSVWLLLPDNEPSGIFFSNQTDDTHGTTNPGLFISVQNDDAGSPQITIEAWDANNTIIVSATYDFTNWATWVNLLISIDTASQTLQVFANTISTILVETELTPVSITWISSNPIASSPTQPFHITARSVGSPKVGEQIAQLVIPSGDLAAGQIGIDWARGKVFLTNQGNPSPCFVYNLALETQNPSVTGNINNFIENPQVDPVTGSLITVGDFVEFLALLKYDPNTLTQIGMEPDISFAVGHLACLGVGTLASGGNTQVGYAVAQSGNGASESGLISVYRTDTMEAVGFSSQTIFPGNGVTSGGISGSANGFVYFATSVGSDLNIYALTISSGAETFSGGGNNPHIAAPLIGTIAASTIDPTATNISCGAIGFDQANNILVLDVTTNGTETPGAFVGANPLTGMVLWQTSQVDLGVMAASLSASSINGQVVVQTEAGAAIINTANGAVATNTFTGVGGSSPIFMASNDLDGLIVLTTTFTQGADSPEPVSGTPSSFSGFAIMTGVLDPPSAAIADLWFGQTDGLLDLTVTTNRRKFITDLGGAQNLPANLSSTLGVSPRVFLSSSGLAASFAENLGRGGPFAVSGGMLQPSPSNPPGSAVSITTPQANSPGQGVLGDFRNGNLYAFNPKTLTDNGTQRKWLRRWLALPAGSSDPKQFYSLYIDIQTGIGVPDGENPQVVLRWSDDGGFTWSHERFASVGMSGQTARGLKFNRLGGTRRYGGSDRIFEISSTDAFLLSILGAEVDAK
jgi:hypothetical protein